MLSHHLGKTTQDNIMENNNMNVEKAGEMGTSSSAPVVISNSAVRASKIIDRQRLTARQLSIYCCINSRINSRELLKQGKNLLNLTTSWIPRVR